MSNYFKRAAIDIGLAGIFSILAMLVSYVFRIVIARNLGPEQFGLFNAVLTFAVFVHLIREPGFRSALIKFLPQWLVNKEYTKINQLITVTLTVWLIGSVFLLLIASAFSGFLADHYFQNAHAQELIILFFLIFLVNNFDYLLAYIFQGYQRIGIFASVDFIRISMFLIITVVGFFWYPGNVFVPVFAYLITPFILTAIYLPILHFSVDRNIRLIKPTMERCKEAVAFGLPVTVTSLLWTGFQYVSILILTSFRTLAEVGLFNAALPTITILVNLAASISLVIFPLASELSARGLEMRLQVGLSLLYRYTFLAVVPLSLALVYFADVVTVLLFGNEYLGAAVALRVLAVGAFFWIIASINFNVLAGIGKSREPLRISLLIGLVVVILNVVLVPVMGILGAAIAVSIGYVSAMILSVISLRKYLPVEISHSFWIKGFFAGAVFVMILGLAKRVLFLPPVPEAAIALCLSGVLYVALLFILGLVKYEELSAHIKALLQKKK